MLPPDTSAPAYPMPFGDADTMLFRAAAGVLTAPYAQQMAARVGNHISHYALHFEYWDHGERLAVDGQAFVDCIRPFCDPTTEVGSRAVALGLTVWQPTVADLGGASSAVTMMLMRNELGKRTLEFSRAVRPNAQRLASAIGIEDLKDLAIEDDNAVAAFIAADKDKPAAIGAFLKRLVHDPAPHRALEDSPYFAVAPVGRALC